MPNKGVKLIAWTREEEDHLVSFGVKIHCEKYPHRSAKAAGQKLTKLRAKSSVKAPPTTPPVDSPTAPNPPTSPIQACAPPPFARIRLPISIHALGRLLVSFAAVLPDDDFTVRQVGDELWIEAWA